MCVGGEVCVQSLLLLFPLVFLSLLIILHLIKVFRDSYSLLLSAQLRGYGLNAKCPLSFLTALTVLFGIRSARLASWGFFTKNIILFLPNPATEWSMANSCPTFCFLTPSWFHLSHISHLRFFFLYNWALLSDEPQMCVVSWFKSHFKYHGACC